MKAVLQRVREARVRCGDEVVGEIGTGLLVLLGVLRGDGEGEAERLAGRIARLRCFEDEDGRMHHSTLDLGHSVLVVSQFTLAADGRKGRRPSFDRAAPPGVARPVYEHFVACLEGLGVPVRTGRFQAEMAVELVNDGPVTFVFDEDPPAGPHA